MHHRHVDEWGWIIVGAFWTLVIGGGMVADKLSERKDAKRKVSYPVSGVTIELDKQCATCNRPLKGVSLTEEDLQAEPPIRAWRVCYLCDFKEQVEARYPWSLEQGDMVRQDERRQEERRLIAEFFHKRHLSKISTLEGLVGGTPTEFEYSVGEILQANGYSSVFVRGGAGDLAVDIECVSPNGDRVAVQCKRYVDKPVGSKELQTFIGMIHQHHGINSGMYVTTSRFTKPAQELARRHNIKLVDQEELLKLAQVLQPDDIEDEKKIRSLEMWKVVHNEKLAEANRLKREAELERRRRGRKWAQVNRRY